MVSWARCGTRLYRFLIFAVFLTLYTFHLFFLSRKGPFQGCAFFVDHSSYICHVFVMLSCASFIDALWSPAGKGLASWLLFVMFIEFCYFPMWYLGSGVVLDCIVT